MIVLIMGIITIVNGYIRSYIKTYHVQGRDNSFVRNLIQYIYILILFILLGSDCSTCCSYIRSTLKLSSFLLAILTIVLTLIVIILVLYIIVIIFITCQPRSKPWGILARQTYLDSYPRNLGPNIWRPPWGIIPFRVRSSIVVVVNQKSKNIYLWLTKKTILS